MALGHALVRSQKKHPRDADDAVDDSQALVLDLDRQIAPTVEVKGVVLLVNGFRYALIKQRKRAFNRGNMNGKV